MEPFEHFQSNPDDQKPAEEAKYASHINPVRTFSSDLAKAVREKGGAVVRSAIAEDQKHRDEFEQRANLSQRKYLMMSIIVLVVTAGAIFGLYEYKKILTVPPPVVTPPPASLLFSESAMTINASGLDAGNVIALIHKASKDTSIREATVKNLVIASNSNARMPAAQFLSFLGTHAPALFLSSLSKEFMMGVSVYNGSGLFLVLRGTAHDFLADGMHTWESHLLGDLAELFDIPDETAAAYNNAPFTNALVVNRDARAVLDASGKPIIFYSFINANTLIITTSPTALSESIRRI